MDIPVFNLSNLKRNFYTFLVICIVVTLASIIARLVFTRNTFTQLVDGMNDWYFIGILVIGSVIVNQYFKKDLKSIKETTDYDLKFKKYETRFKKRLLWNAIAIAITGVIFNAHPTKYMFYLLLIQVIFLPAFYPWKKVIARELDQEDIVFT